MSDELTDKELEELLKMASKEPSKEEQKFYNMNEVEKFCYDKNIKASDTDRVPAFYIWDLYERYKGKYKLKLSKTKFFMEFKKMFKKQKRKDGVHYWIDKKPFDMSKKKYWEIRRKMRNQKKRAKRKAAEERKILMMTDKQGKYRGEEAEKESDSKKQS